MPQIDINSDLLITQPMSDDTWTWTLASRLGDMLHMAEELFGARDCSYTILGIEFAPNPPQAQFSRNRRHIIIQLSFSAATDMSGACYELAHETVHLLAPTGGNDATNFEEGVACYFADHYMMEREIDRPEWGQCLPRNYKRALEAVTLLLDKDIYCVRKLRSYQPSFRDMTEEDIIKEFPDLTPDDVEFLVSKFE